MKCPYGKIHKQTGYTKAAKKCGELSRDAKKQYPDAVYAVKELSFMCRIGDYIYLPLPWLGNYVNPFMKDDIVSDYLLPSAIFTKETVIDLIRFRPRALFGGVIDDYQKKYVPAFCNQLKRYFPDMYEAVKQEFPEIESYVESVNYKGKFAYVKTLLPGRVEISIYTFEWDGEILTGKAKDMFYSGVEDEVMQIIPTDTTCVKILDNSTVTEETVFRDE